MGIEEERKLEDRRRKKLILLASDNPLWDQVALLERRANVSFAELRQAALPDQYGKKKSGQADGRRSRSALRLAGKIRSVSELSPSEILAAAARATHGRSSREDLLGLSSETLRKMAQGLLKPGNRALQGLDALRDALSVAVRLFDNAEIKSEKIEQDTPSDDDTSERRQLSAEADRLLGKVAAFKADLEAGLDKSMLVYDAGFEFLDLGIKETQEKIDTALFATRPLLTKPYFSDWDAAQRIFREVEGFYHAWVGRFVENEKYWMRCCVHVRYIIQLSGGFVIRAKLNVPIFNPSSSDYFETTNSVSGGKKPAHEYDGFCDAQAGGRIYWVWEKRSRTREDYAFWITTPPLKEGLRIPGQGSPGFTGCTGQYLTCHQDMAQTVVGGSVILEPEIHGPRNKNDYQKMARIKMWEDPFTFEPGDPEFERVNALAASLGLPHAATG